MFIRKILILKGNERANFLDSIVVSQLCACNLLLQLKINKTNKKRLKKNKSLQRAREKQKTKKKQCQKKSSTKKSNNTK